MRLLPLALLALFPLSTVACGIPQEELDAKNREIESLSNQLSAQKQRAASLDGDYREAMKLVEKLKKEAKDRGVSLEELNLNLQEQKRALDELRGRAEQLEKMKARFKALREKLRKLVAEGLKIEVRDNRMVIALPGDVLFASGSADLTKKGKEILNSVSKVVREDADLAAREFQVAGHTDSKPFNGGPFIDNWGLSAMRARSVVVYMTGPIANGGGLKAENWSAAGYADTDRVVRDEKSDTDRQKNRRVEIAVVPDVKEMLDLESLVDTGGQ